MPQGVRVEVLPPVVVPSYVIDVGRAVKSWRWTSVLLAPLELLAVIWAIPFVILVAGLPVVLLVASIYWLGRFVTSYF